MTMPQHVTVLTKTTEHGGQLPNTVGNDFQKSAVFFQIGVDIMHFNVPGASMMRPRMGVFASASVAAMVACGGTATDRAGRDGAAADGATAISLIDSVAVVETDSVFVGKPNAIAVDAAGRVYISDMSEKRVLRVERDGSGLVPITRSGGGPREVMRPTSLALVGDSVLAVQDGGQRRATLFDRTTTQPRRSIAMGWPSTTIRGWHDGLLVGSLPADSGTAFALLTDSATAPQRGGSVPRIYNEEPAHRAGVRQRGSRAR
ncbi:hypothetical protein [Gemmatimonas sp.]|uniref:hypothetical protein n=1 Tax=Gemmatimonas sp. TaxID=1962908 RepID=UPI00286D7BC4|nr:hypothetical protein [Gemmatimonas sp.]